MPSVFLDRIADWPNAAAAQFTDLRYLILRAAQDAQAGPISESLKWSEPAWRPTRPRQGCTLRAAWSPKSPDRFGLFVDCKTTLAETMRSLYPADFTYEGNRALYLPLGSKVPPQAIDHLARLTFCYHQKRAA